MGRSVIGFLETGEPVHEPVAKVGGQPVWLQEPQWPLSAALGVPMTFIGQFPITDATGPDGVTLAYLFMTGSSAADAGLSTWAPDAGENAVIVQPDGRLPRVEGTPLRVTDTAEGPTLGADHRMVTLEPPGGDDPDLQFYGGEPQWLQGDEHPGAGWRLLVQLDSTALPLEVNFGDAGIGYAFVSPDGRDGRFLWQCA